MIKQIMQVECPCCHGGPQNVGSNFMYLSEEQDFKEDMGETKEIHTVFLLCKSCRTIFSVKFDKNGAVQ